MGDAPDPDELIGRLREAAGEAPLPPLVVSTDAVSTRPGPVGPAISAVRRQVVRLITPALAELIAQLERDRHRQRGEIEVLRARLARLEAIVAARTGDGGDPGGPHPPH